MSQSMMLVTGDGLGRGDDELGRRLMIKFLGQMASLPEKPDLVAFTNGGVKLLAPGSPSLESLRALERDGVELIACGTCVEHFALIGQLQVGRVTDMREIAASMALAAKVVTL